MKQLLRIEVEPLSNQRWERIERSLTERLQRQALQTDRVSEQRSRTHGLRTWLVAAAAMAAVAAALLVTGPWSEPATLEHPSRITTGQSPSHLALPGLALDVQPESAVVVSAETPQGLLIVLDRGGIVCQVAPRSKEAPLIVQAGEARVLVLGTRFSVTRLGETARVSVHEGVVEVTSRGRSRKVQAGEEWLAESPQQSSSHLERSVDDEYSIGDRNSTDDRSSDEKPPAPTAASPARRGSRAVEKPVAKDRRPALEASGIKPRQALPAATPPKATPSAAATAVATGSTGPRSSQAMFEEATALERSDPARATSLYRRLEAGRDSWAQNALYARGRLEASRGNPGEARRLLEMYLERFPHGSNAEDARAVLRRLR